MRGPVRSVRISISVLESKAPVVRQDVLSVANVLFDVIIVILAGVLKNGFDPIVVVRMAKVSRHFVKVVAAGLGKGVALHHNFHFIIRKCVVLPLEDVAVIGGKSPFLTRGKVVIFIYRSRSC